MLTIVSPSAAVRLDRERLSNAGLGEFFRPHRINALGITYDQFRAPEVWAGATLSMSPCTASIDSPLRIPLSTRTRSCRMCTTVPNAVVCFITALSVDQIGTRLPHELWIAYPLTNCHSGPSATSAPGWSDSAAIACTYGKRNAADSTATRRASPAPDRTVVDCFRFERLIGREAALEALQDALSQRKVTTDALVRTLEVLPSTAAQRSPEGCFSVTTNVAASVRARLRTAMHETGQELQVHPDALRV